MRQHCICNLRMPSPCHRSRQAFKKTMQSVHHQGNFRHRQIANSPPKDIKMKFPSSTGLISEAETRGLDVISKVLYTFVSRVTWNQFVNTSPRTFTLATLFSIQHQHHHKQWIHST